MFKVFVLMIAFLSAVGLALAQTEELTIGNSFGVGARAMGMGGAFIAVADDFTATHWNPAGLAQVRKFEILGGISHSQLNTTTQFNGASPTEADRPRTRLNALGMVFPLFLDDTNLVLAFGFNRIQSFDSLSKLRGLDPSDDPDFGGLFVDERLENSGGIRKWSFAVAFNIAEGLKFGGGLDFWHGENEYTLDVTASDVNRIDSDLDRFRFADSILREFSGVGGKIGILAKAGDNFKFGGTIGFPLQLNIDEDWVQNSFFYFDDGTDESDSDDGITLFDLKRPFELAAGASVRLGQFLIAADAQYVDWTQSEYSTPPAEDISNRDFEDFYRDTLQLRTGVEFLIPEIQTKVRAGFISDPLAFLGNQEARDEFLKDRKDDIKKDRNFITFGIGRVFAETMKFDISYVRGSWERSAPSLKKEQTSNWLLFSAAYRF